jgi:hypothetical protein
MKGESAIQTGDINLAAAIMACGIPLNPAFPAKVIESSDGHNYASFGLMQTSEDGKEKTNILMTYWSDGSGIPAHHPFVRICQFIKGKPQGRLTPDDWLSYAVSYLSSLGVSLPGLRRVSDIDLFVSNLPDAPESYILAFVGNRAVCLELYKKARRSIHQNIGDAHTMIDSDLPLAQRRELLSRLQG